MSTIKNVGHMTPQLNHQKLPNTKATRQSPPQKHHNSKRREEGYFYIVEGTSQTREGKIKPHATRLKQNELILPPNVIEVHSNTMTHWCIKFLHTQIVLSYE
jgi:hypothetical protein